METPLLVEACDDYAPVKRVWEVNSVFWRETVKLWKIAGPIAATVICNSGVISVTVIFAGHLGDLELSAVTISLCVINTFSFGFMLGMGSALETLCGQAVGAGKLEKLGIYIQRSWIILLASSFLLLPIYIFAASILKLVGLNDDVANLAGRFTLMTIPQLFSLALNFPTQKFLQAQSKVAPLAWINVASLGLHVALLGLFVSVFDWGLVGAAVAVDVTSWFAVAAQVVYVLGWCGEAWTGFSWLAFAQIWGFVKLSFASAIMLCLEVWYMMSLIVITGHLSHALLAVDSLSICMTVNGMEFMIFIGINAAISVRVSNELGSGRSLAAKYAVYATVFQSLLIGIFFSIVILVTKDYFAIIFTRSVEVQRAVARLASLLGVTMILNSIQPVISGVAIGGGWQSLVAYINLGCYYGFGLPLGYLLGYRANFGVMGIWGGMICGLALQTLLLLIVLYKTNWQKEVEQASERMRTWE